MQTLNVTETAGLVTRVRLKLEHDRGRIDTPMDMAKVERSARQKYGSHLTIKQMLDQLPAYKAYLAEQLERNIAWQESQLEGILNSRRCHNKSAYSRYVSEARTSIAKLKKQHSDYLRDPDKIDFPRACKVEPKHGLCAFALKGLKRIHHPDVQARDFEKKQLVYQQANDYVFLELDDDNAVFILANSVIKNKVVAAAEQRTTNKVKNMDLEL